MKRKIRITVTVRESASGGYSETSIKVTGDVTAGKVIGLLQEEANILREDAGAYLRDAAQNAIGEEETDKILDELKWDEFASGSNRRK
jgi:hypothetical protein